MQSNKAIQASQASAGELPQRVSSIKQYLRQGRIIVAVIARYSGLIFPIGDTEKHIAGGSNRHTPDAE